VARGRWEREGWTFGAPPRDVLPLLLQLVARRAEVGRAPAVPLRDVAAELALVFTEDKP
jgi:hypothetical protein